jgi:hypothetical protein
MIAALRQTGQRSLSRLGMGGDRMSRPRRTVRVVDAVPDASGAGHFGLPLLHRHDVDKAEVLLYLALGRGR